MRDRVIWEEVYPKNLWKCKLSKQLTKKSWARVDLPWDSGLDAGPLDESINDCEHFTYYGRALAVVHASLEVDLVKVAVSAEDCETKALIIPSSF
jgi:hypothetical protein